MFWFEKYSNSRGVDGRAMASSEVVRMVYLVESSEVVRRAGLFNCY